MLSIRKNDRVQVIGGADAGKVGRVLEVFPNDPSKMLTLDDVDWNQIPPDNNTGIPFPVQLDVASRREIREARFHLPLQLPA